MKELLVNEIFLSVQGEGTRSGRLCTFVRLQGCGLRCTWCDTPYALEHKKDGVKMSFDDIVQSIVSKDCKFVEFTGGEPLEQAGCLDLIKRLCEDGYEIAVETGGHVDISQVDSRATIIMDVKCPGSGMMKRNLIQNLEYLKKGDEVKFVLSDRQDYDWAKQFVEALDSVLQGKELLFSPVFGALDNKTLAEWIIEDKLKVRMQLQLHKYTWDPDARGV
jgi:7-carboxy-7-deazaguanine synthase